MMALLLVVVLEVAGLFLFNGFLNIPSESQRAAYIVFHCMVFSLLFGVSTTPFGGLLVAHEQFPFLSAIGISNYILKLLIAIIISTLYSDKLIVYGCLMTGLGILIGIVNITFCLWKYHNQMSFLRVCLADLRGIIGFAGWTLLDVVGSMANREGYAVMLNKFFGPVVNATFALSRQIEGHLYTVSSSVINTIKPQIMASQGANNQDRVFRLSLTAGKFGFIMMSFIAIPLYIMMPDILTLWLKNVPEGTVLFSRLLVAACMAEQMTRGLVYANQALGNIKWFSVVVSGIRMMALPLSVVALLFGCPAHIAIVIFVVCESLGSLSRVFILSRISDFKTSFFFSQVFLRVIPPFVVSFCLCQYLYQPGNGLMYMIGVSLITVGVYATAIYICGLTRYEKKSFFSLIPFHK